ncbi:unnamed protein product [Ilex paraguariensis]|uniref:WLM domain-containing protein n=1 Tax=Ilex paraguariensis TaxID=185542 RepID=A0ABC8SWX3_9AQUA
MMQQEQDIRDISVTWRTNKFVLKMRSDASLKDLGHNLQELTGVEADTMRLIVPSNKSSKLLSPFSDEHSFLSLQEASAFEGKSIRMMGVPKDEVDEVIQNAKTDLRIAGFDEEDKRLRQRMLDRPHTSMKLPQGTYIFCDFRTLHIPGIELNPPASQALKLMHMLAADPGIIAIMNKHRWRVGIMTEMAPVGYVGVSPKCILGFNKNHGEEISLRLRTDDLKGFRKYESIKKTLLHELAHMVFSEHDANFYALDKQLNQEAATLDWTKSRSHSLSGVKYSEHFEEEFNVDSHSSLSRKLGGEASDQLANARASSVAAAYRRVANTSAHSFETSGVREEPDPDDSGSDIHKESECMDFVRKEVNIMPTTKARWRLDGEPDPDDSESSGAMEFEPYSRLSESRTMAEPDPDDSEMALFVPPLMTDMEIAQNKPWEEPDPDDLEVSLKNGVVIETVDSRIQPWKINHEPDTDESGAGQNNTRFGNIAKPVQDSLVIETLENKMQLNEACKEPDADDPPANGIMRSEPDPDDDMVAPQGISGRQDVEPDPDDQELQRIQDPVAVVCGRLQKAIEMLRSEVHPSEAATVLQTLFKIIRNVIEHPDEIKFKRLRKLFLLMVNVLQANPRIQRDVVNYKAALEILTLIGFNEDVVLDEIGKAETYLVLKRNDPGLLWLAKSSLETCIAY